MIITYGTPIKVFLNSDHLKIIFPDKDLRELQIFFFINCNNIHSERDLNLYEFIILETNLYPDNYFFEKLAKAGFIPIKTVRSYYLDKFLLKIKFNGSQIIHINSLDDNNLNLLKEKCNFSDEDIQKLKNLVSNLQQFLSGLIYEFEITDKNIDKILNFLVGGSNGREKD